MSEGTKLGFSSGTPCVYLQKSYLTGATNFTPARGLVITLEGPFSPVQWSMTMIINEKERDNTCFCLSDHYRDIQYYL